MQVMGGRSDAQQLRAGRSQLHEHGLHQVFGFGLPARKRQGVPKQRRCVPVIQVTEGFAPARRELAKQFPVAWVITSLRHS